MEKITLPQISYQRSERFQVLPLPHWSLAVTKLNGKTFTATGLGFDVDRRIALEKSYAEAIERFVYETWRLSGVCPFEGHPTNLLPPGEAGMAVHQDEKEGKWRAFAEWRERALMAQAGAGNYRLVESTVPKLWALFEPLVTLSGVSIRCFIGEGEFPLAVAFGFLRDGGVIFGSSARMRPADALNASVCECIRKIAFLKSWRAGLGRNEDTTLFLDTVAFWLSSKGVDSVNLFIDKATGATGEARVPTNPLANLMAHAFSGDRWHVYSYYDPSFELPKVLEHKLPLV